MSCGGGHLGFSIGIENRNFVEDLPMTIPGQFGFNHWITRQLLNNQHWITRQLLNNQHWITRQLLNNQH
jgi:hypothetical protein